MLKGMVRIFFVVLLLLSIFVGGCQTLTRDKEQQIRKYSRISNVNRRLLAEDSDRFFLLDRPSRLTPWHMRSD